MKAEILDGLPIDDYHRRPEWSHSQVETLIVSPPLFYGRHIAKTIPRESSEAMDVGTIVHKVLTEHLELSDVVAEIPVSALNGDGHRKGAGWKAFAEANAGRFLLKPAEIAPIRAMIRSVEEALRQWPVWRWDAVTFEQSIIYECDATGLSLRARPDAVMHVDGVTIVVDFKTTRAVRPRDFARDMATLGYHRQAAWYLDAMAAVGVAANTFLFIAVDKTPAHSTWLYELSQEAIALGRAENLTAKIELAARIASNDWHEPHYGEIVPMDLPRWKYAADPFSLLPWEQ